MQRNTKQREVIVACFFNENRPMCVTEIHAIATRQYPSLGIATVYRAINVIVDNGILALVVIGGTTLYELANRRQYYHFYCQKCDNVCCLEGTLLAMSRLAPKNFAVEEYHLVVSGICLFWKPNVRREQ